MTITTGLNYHFQQLNNEIKAAKDETIIIENCLGQRYIGAGIDNKTIIVYGTPGNALGAYMNGAKIIVNGNGQDAIGDTMNNGTIIIYGNAGDAVGYAMRGGKIYIQGNVGYRSGIHMKSYMEHKPCIIIGGSAGCFLGEYQAGGTIVVLGLHSEAPIINDFCATGMHGGEIILRTDELPYPLPMQVQCEKIDISLQEELMSKIKDYCEIMKLNLEEVLDHPYLRITPNTDNPYKKMYTNN